jgi:hypothetical protein
MFGLSVVSISLHARPGWLLALSEFVATFGLILVIFGCSRQRASAVPFAVAAYITAAYWFTASTSSANPAVTIARSLSNTFSGIRPVDVPLFRVRPNRRAIQQRLRRRKKKPRGSVRIGQKFGIKARFRRARADSNVCPLVLSQFANGCLQTSSSAVNVDGFARAAKRKRSFKNGIGGYYGNFLEADFWL